MRIIVNDIAASEGGALTVLKDFYRYLVDSNDKNEWIFLLGGRYLEETNNIKIIILDKVKKSKFEKIKFDLFTGRYFINELKPDLVFSLQNIITFGVKCKQVVYVHQPLPFQNEKNYSFLKSQERHCAVYQHLIGGLIKMSIRKADKTIVQTEWMKEAVIKKCRILRQKVIKIIPNVNLKQFSKFRQCNQFSNQSFFYPTGTPIYKNTELLLDATKILNKRNLEFKVEITLEREECGIRNVEFIGRLPYEDVVKKYFNSCLVFPSYIETFGYPLAEAKAAGTIILASDCSFSREILTGYNNAYFFQPHDASQLANLMEKVISGQIVKNPNICINEYQTNSWKDVVENLIEC